MTEPQFAAEPSTAAAAPAIATPANAPPPSVAAEGEPNWLPSRLERERETERRKILSELGVENVSNGKAAIKAHKEAQEAAKTREQQLADRVALLESRDRRATELETVLGARARSEFDALDEEKRKAVASLAGDDPAKMIQFIDALKPTWLSQPTAVAAAPKPIAPPANTTPVTTAPAPGSAAPVSRLAEWRALQSQNYVAAAQYLLTHQAEISRERNAQR